MLGTKIDIKEIRYESVYWIHLAHDSDKGWALVTTAMNLLVT